MGSCLSNQGKAESPSHTGMGSSKTSGRDGSGLDNLTRNTPSTFSPQIPRMEVEILQSANLKSFSFSQLRSATKNFRPDSVLGEGGFGSVYKGWINENTLEASRPTSSMVVAVKRLNQDGRQGHKEWLAEINYLGQIRHPNLVKLIGYCLEENHRLLVYEFMPKGSLENHLFWKGLYFKPLSWSLRMKIALDAATGFAFLHSDKIKVIFRDFKASNILLDSNYNAKLSDFGLARDGPADDKSHVSTRIMGTHGYAAPEYISTGHLTSKSDVYSFGVVLLEILTGRKAIDKTQPTGEQNLVDWAKPYLTNKRRICRALDPVLDGQYPVGRARKAAGLALGCLSTVPRSRPGMDEVVKALEELQDSKDVSKIEKKEARLNRHDNNRPKQQTQGITGLKAYPRPSGIAL